MPVIQNEINDTTVDENQAVEFTAKVTCEPVPEIEWSHNGTVLKNDVNFKVKNTKLYKEYGSFLILEVIIKISESKKTYQSLAP